TGGAAMVAERNGKRRLGQNRDAVAKFRNERRKLAEGELVLALRGGVGFSIGFLATTEEVEAGGFVRSGEFCRFGKVFDGSRRRHFGKQLNAAVVFETGAGGNEPAHDDVFLEAAEIVHLAGNGGFGKDAGGLLEAGSRDEGIGGERRLGDTEEQGTSSSGTAAFGDHAVVLFAEAELVHLLFEEEGGVADVFHLDPAHHLPGDGLNVLVVDVDTLQAVDLLNGVDEVSLGVLFAENRKQVVEIERSVDESLTGSDVFAFLNVDVNAARNGIFLGGLAIFGFDVN